MKSLLETDRSPDRSLIQNAGAVVIGGHFQGLGILRSLSKHNIPVYLLDNKLCISRFSKYVKKYFKCPPVTQETNFLMFLKELAVKEHIEGWILYPEDDETVVFMAKNKETLSKYFRVPTPPWEITRFASEKRLTYLLAEKFNIATPLTCYPDNIEGLARLPIRYPVILKPSVKEPFYSLTRKKAIRINNQGELLSNFASAKSICPHVELMVQELIPGGSSNLFSVGSFFKNGELVGKIVAKRIRQHPMDFGHATTYAISVSMPELEEIARRFLRAMAYYGLSEIEFMFDERDGRYKLIEMNARTWGWHSLALYAGVDLPYLLFKDMYGQKVYSDQFTKGIKWSHIITDFPTVFGEFIRGRMHLSDVLNSIKGIRNDAVFSFLDPVPFLMEILMAPYLWIKRGF